MHATPGTPAFNDWVGTLFFLPAVFGGIFGLLGGYLTDRFGRRRILTWSILLYAFSAFASGFATNIYWLLLFRCTTFIGVCVEFVAAAAWLAELFEDPKRREKVLGYTQAFWSIGGIMVTGVYYLVVRYADHLPAIHGGHAAWRYTLISGVIPALPLIFIRPFLPESPIWQQKKQAGTLKRPSVGELFAPQFRVTTIVTTIMFACSFGAAFGAIQHMPRIVPGIEEVRTLARPAQQVAVAAVQSYQEFGGLLGRIVLAILAVQIVGRRRLLWLFQVPGLFVVPIVFFFAADESLELGEVGHLPRRVLHRLAVQLLGELPAPRLSDLPARDGRELRRQRRRPHDRHVRGVGDAQARELDARRRAGATARLRGRHRRAAGVPRRVHRQLQASGAEEGAP